MIAVLVAIATAHAASFEDYDLGEYYRIGEVTDPVVQHRAAAVVQFSGATGFIVSPDGYVLTNYHVYDGFGDSGRVYRSWDGRRFAEALDLELVVADERYDMALYRARTDHPLPYIPIRTSNPRIGEPVFVVGHPHSWGQRVSFGKVLADDLVIGGRPSVEYSAQTWWGSSGSPVIDRDGNAIALHWGWDSDGRSHGRLTGVPFDQMAAAIPEIARIAAGVSSAPAVAVRPGVPDRCHDADNYALRSDLVQAGHSRNAAGRLRDRVQVTVASEDATCLRYISDVTYHLHPTFRDPVARGDAGRAGAPLTLLTWGFFEAKAEIQLADASDLIVDGYVRWK